MHSEEIFLSIEENVETLSLRVLITVCRVYMIASTVLEDKAVGDKSNKRETRTRTHKQTPLTISHIFLFASNAE